MFILSDTDYISDYAHHAIGKQIVCWLIIPSAIGPTLSIPMPSFLARVTTVPNG